MVPVVRENYIDRALHEPDSKVMDVDLIQQGFARGLKNNDGIILFNSEVINISKNNNIWSVKTDNNEFTAPIQFLINQDCLVWELFSLSMISNWFDLNRYLII